MLLTSHREPEITHFNSLSIAFSFTCRKFNGCSIVTCIVVLKRGAYVRGSLQKFCTLYVLSLQMNSFYKILIQAFIVISIVLYHSGPAFGQSCIPARTPSLLMRRITRFTSLDTSSLFLKRFPRSGFFNFGNKSKSGGLMSGLYGGWGSTCHPYFSKISDTAPEA